MKDNLVKDLKKRIATKDEIISNLQRKVEELEIKLEDAEEENQRLIERLHDRDRIVTDFMFDYSTKFFEE